MAMVAKGRTILHTHLRITSLSGHQPKNVCYSVYTTTFALYCNQANKLHSRPHQLVNTPVHCVCQLLVSASRNHVGTQTDRDRQRPLWLQWTHRSSGHRQGTSSNALHAMAGSPVLSHLSAGPYLRPIAMCWCKPLLRSSIVSCQPRPVFLGGHPLCRLFTLHVTSTSF
jgi:hypothetical protein